MKHPQPANQTHQPTRLTALPARHILAARTIAASPKRHTLPHLVSACATIMQFSPKPTERAAAHDVLVSMGAA